MFKAISSTEEFIGAQEGYRVAPGVSALHKKCGVYTHPSVVNEILDAIGWTAEQDLCDARLLEPAAGDGIFVAAAAERLIRSLQRHKVTLSAATLSNRILAFEIHPRAAAKARLRLQDTLAELRIPSRLRKLIISRWIVCGDFLVSPLATASFSHVAGNPPYARWSKIPRVLRERYEKRLPRHIARGDIFLPFLDLCIEYLQPGGRLGFICSDRWKYMAFASEFRTRRLPEISIEHDRSVLSSESFLRDVDVYSTVLVLRREARSRAIRQRLGQPTLSEAGYEIRVGPALGCTQAFVLEPEEKDVEQSLLVPWFDPTEIVKGAIVWKGRRVITLYDERGELRSLRDYPLALKRFRKFRHYLNDRSIVKNGAPWYRTIDRVVANVWSRPKLVIPELAKIPRFAVDLSGAVPSHGTYAIFSPDNDLEKIRRLLDGGGLERALVGISPKVKGGYVRCYRKFLEQIRIG